MSSASEDEVSTDLTESNAVDVEPLLDTSNREEEDTIDKRDLAESSTKVDMISTDMPAVNETAHPIGGETDGKRPGLKPLSEGTQLNKRYQIVRKIGGGGMGAVYLAWDQNLGGVERAVKEMVQSSIEEEQQNKAIDDFKRESTILSTLDHPSIPTIYDYFFDDAEGRFYLVMKYISGGDLAARLRAAPGGRIDEKTVTEWALQLADVLAYLHGLPTTIVYRDLKPSNIMLDGSTGRVMLIDFGIARSINQAQEKGVTAVGTMGYAPPELFSGQVEPRSDIYSLGSTMFHLLTGADPQNNPLLIFDFQKNPRPRQINPQLSDQMERILMRSVEYNADSRFSSADEMRRTLADHLEHLKIGNITFGVTEAPAAVSLANQSVFCGFCGQRIVATDLFCAFCGAKQPIAQQGVHAEIYSRSGATAKLMIEGTGELDTPVYSLEKNENLLGRRDPQSNIFPEVDLSKYDPQTKISRRHARIWREGGNFMVEDLGSSNGTILLAGVSDSLRLQPRQPHALSSGDRLRLGDTTLHFLMG
ncbi:MAG: FHA domain-containing serine/threonine-protein kinase [Pyrinomonadaceae bacterium]